VSGAPAYSFALASSDPTAQGRDMGARPVGSRGLVIENAAGLASWGVFAAESVAAILLATLDLRMEIP